MALLQVRNLHVCYGPVKAIAGFDLDIPEGPWGVGLVGESGSGKTTIVRALLRLIPASSGTIAFDGRNVLRLRGKQLAAFRRAVQVVLQDPGESLDPKMRIGAAVSEVLRTHRVVDRRAIAERVCDLLAEVGLSPDLATRLSGGQCQRAVIARALAVEPRFLIMDEPTSALDVTVQARVLALVERLRAERRLSYLLVSHNLAIVQRLCEEIAVLYLGRVVERGPTLQVLKRPAHPYTAALLSAVPRLGADHAQKLLLVQNAMPADTANLPSGCTFHPRCLVAVEKCPREVPILAEIAPGRTSACHRAAEIFAGEVVIQSGAMQQNGTASAPVDNR
jgi:oligopeptide/dipeptide ABC transporter ATP-binding protein